MGATWYASPGATVDSLPPLLEQYREACDRSGTRPRVTLRRDVLILSDGDRARKLLADRIAAGYRGLTPDHLVAGSPTDAADQLAAFRDLGVDQVVVRTMGVDPETDLETIASCAEVRHLLT